MNCIISNEIPVPNNEGTEYEVLAHSQEAVDLSHVVSYGMVVLSCHGRGQQPVGIIHGGPEVDTETGELRGEITFLPNEAGRLYEEDARQGRRCGLSLEAERLAIENGGTLRGLPVKRITRWKPLYVVFTPMPRNPLAKIVPGGRYQPGRGNSETL